MPEEYEIYSLINKDPSNLSRKNLAPMNNWLIHGNPKVGNILKQFGDFNGHIDLGIIYYNIVQINIDTPKKIILCEFWKTNF